MSCINAIQIFMQVPVVEVEVVFSTSSTTSTWRGGGPARPHRRRTAVGWCTALCSNRPPAAHAAHCQAASSQRVRASDRQQTPVRNSVGQPPGVRTAGGGWPPATHPGAGGRRRNATAHHHPTDHQPSMCATPTPNATAAATVEQLYSTWTPPSTIPLLVLCRFRLRGFSCSSEVSRRNHAARTNLFPFRIGCTWCKFSKPLVKASKRPARGATKRSQSSSLNANQAP